MVDSEALKRLLAMRADDDTKDSYAAQYSLTSEDNNREPDWELFNELWQDRHDSEEEMASLLAEVMGIEYEEALAWVTQY